MKRFAILDTNSGYIWNVVNADSALDACYVCDRDIGAFRGEGHYEPISISEINSTRGIYDVREAPADYDVKDGLDTAAIDAVCAMPRAGLFSWVPAE